MGRLMGTLAVTRAFGDLNFHQYGLISAPEIRKIELRLSHKYLLVASDGLWDFVSLKVIHKILKEDM